MMPVRIRHWFAALSAAALTHAGLVGLFYESSQPPAGAKAIGLSGIEIALGPAGGAPGAARMETESTETADEDQQLPDAVEAVQTVQPESVLEAKPEPKVEAKPLPSPEQKPASKPRPVAPVPTPRPELKAETPAETKTKPVAQARAVGPATAVPHKQSATRGANGKRGAKDRPESGDGDTGAGGGIPGAKRDYFALLSAWLERHKQYPSRAQRRGQEGTVYLRFVVDREGKVLSYRIERTSGHDLLDREVEKMIRRAAPLPAMPNQLAQSRLELVVPVSFYMR